MNLAGFSFSKISIERFSTKIDKLKINTKIDVSDVSKLETQSLGKTLLKADFSYILDYSPDFAKLEFKGSVLFYANDEELEKTLKEWKDKKMSDEFQTLLFNIILRKTNVKALELEDELNLPFHMQMPSLKKKEE